MEFVRSALVGANALHAAWEQATYALCTHADVPNFGE